MRTQATLCSRKPKLLIKSRLYILQIAAVAFIFFILIHFYPYNFDTFCSYFCLRSQAALQRNKQDAEEKRSDPHSHHWIVLWTHKEGSLWIPFSRNNWRAPSGNGWTEGEKTHDNRERQRPKRALWLSGPWTTKSACIRTVSQQIGLCISLRLASFSILQTK